jgi:hypothetical protein
MTSTFTDNFENTDPSPREPERQVDRVQRRSADRRSARQGTFTVSVKGQHLRLLNFSSSGMAVLFPPGISLPSNGQLSLNLHQNEHHIANLTMRIIHASRSNEGTVVGGAFDGGDIVPLARSRPPETGDIVEVRDSTFKAEVFERIMAAPLRVAIRLISDRTLRAVLGAAPDMPSTFRLEMDENERPIGQLVDIELEFHDCELTLRGKVSVNDRNEPVLKPPWRIFSLARRRCERVRAPLDLAVLEWHDPLDPDKKRLGRVVDVSPRGLAVAISRHSLPLMPAPPFPVTLRLGDAVVSLLAEVHHCSELTDEELLVGLSIVPVREPGGIQLMAMCQSIRWPSLVRRRDVGIGEVSAFMRATGYLDLRDGPVPDAEWHTLPGDESLSIDSVYLGERGAILGHISCLRLYPRTWLYHQLATSSVGRGAVAYPLYLQVLEWTSAMAGQQGFGLAYFNQERPWHQLLFGGFVRWVGSEALAVTSTFDRLEMSAEAVDLPVAEGGVIVDEATRSELAFVVRLTRTAIPLLLADALHFDVESISTPSLCDEHTIFGLERTRVTFVARKNGSICGAAICETGSRRLSLFNIVNVAHVFVVEPLSFGLARAVEGALLSKVRRFYGSKGIVDPLIVTPEGNVKFPETAGLVAAETMGVWATSLEGLKQYKNFLHFEFGEMAQGRRKEPASGRDVSQNRTPERKG